MSTEYSSTIDSTWPRQQIESGEVLGLAWSVSIGGQRQLDSAGTVTLEAAEPVEPDTIFRISSMTKPVTAVAALILVDERRIMLDDPVDEWLPELANHQVLRNPKGAVEDTVRANRSISLCDLLTFRMGWGMDFSDFSSNPLSEAMDALELGAGPPQPQVPPDPDEWLRRLATVPLRYQPGERWLYHDSADVLGVLICRVSGQPLEDFLAERIFAPLKMRDTGFVVPAEKLSRFGPCYMTMDGDRTVFDPADGQWSSPPAFPSGGAGLVSTVPDFTTFGELLSGEGSTAGVRLLRPESVAEMTTDQLTESQRMKGPDPDGAVGWGFGVGVQVEARPNRPVGSYGWDGGLGSTWFNDPRSGKVAVCMTNEMWTSPEPAPICNSFWSAATATA